VGKKKRIRVKKKKKTSEVWALLFTLPSLKSIIKVPFQPHWNLSFQKGENYKPRKKKYLLSKNNLET